MTGTIIIDSGTIISMVTNSLFWNFKYLSKQYKGEFLIPQSVYDEIITYPLSTRRFKLEAVMVNDYILEGYIKVENPPELANLSSELMELANNIYIVDKEPLKILHKAEVDVLALAVHLKSDAILVDERSLRLLLEDPNRLLKLLGDKLHTKVQMNKGKLDLFQELTKDIRVLRSTELITISFELGFLDRYITSKNIVHKKYKKSLLEGALWALKLKGCSISEEEIKEIIKFEGFEA
nr:hypothetical protein [Nanoarchaeum sp.]